jgi:hypothetical protein
VDHSSTKAAGTNLLRPDMLLIPFFGGLGQKVSAALPVGSNAIYFRKQSETIDPYIHQY